MLIAAACRQPLNTALPGDEIGTATPLRSSTPVTLTPPPDASLPTPAATAIESSATPPAISPTASNPNLLTPSTVEMLEPVGAIQYSPWDLVLAVAWSPDGNLLAVAAGESIYLYTADLQARGRLDAGTWTTSLAFDPEGAWLASGGRDGNIHIWELDSQKLLLRFAAHKKGVNAVAFTPDGALLASAGNDAVARLWDPVTGEKRAEMIGGTYAVPSIAFNPDGSELAITNGELVRVRDVESGRFAHTLRSQGSNYSVAWSPDGRLVAAGNTTGEVALWEVISQQPSGTITQPVAMLDGASSMVWSLDFSPDRRAVGSQRQPGDDLLVGCGGKEPAGLTPHQPPGRNLAGIQPGRSHPGHRRAGWRAAPVGKPLKRRITRRALPLLPRRLPGIRKPALCAASAAGKPAAVHP